MFVELTRWTMYGTQALAAGVTVLLPDEEAQRLIAEGAAREATAAAEEAQDEAQARRRGRGARSADADSES